MIQVRITILLIVLTQVYGQHRTQGNRRYQGDQCTLESNGEKGFCTKFSECTEAQNELKNKQKFPQTCSFVGTEPVVCCPLTESPTTPTTTTTTRATTTRKVVTSSNSREVGAISKRKCREYSGYAILKEQNPVLLINSGTITRKECGHTVVRLVVGGEPATRMEFPHMVGIGFETTPGNIEYVCGGTILSRSWILTAAHCLSDDSYGDAKWALLGVSVLNDTSHRQVIPIVERIPFPEYKPPSHYHDIALVKLGRPADMNPWARPACLYLNHDIDAERAIATGWGHTSWGGEGSNKLMKVTIDLFNHTFCNASYRNQISRRLDRGILDDIQVCAGSVEEEKDTCQGDSGGPLQIYHVRHDNVDCMYDIVGVTSFGKACSGSPGVYVRVSNYIKWIEDIVWP